LSLVELASVLGAAYRDSDGKRPVPSAGALYPLELYVVPLAVEQLDQAAYHYHPYRHRLEHLRASSREEVGAALVDPTLAGSAAALVVGTAMFFRSRFKYGLRGSRFALVVAVHVGLYAVLADGACGVAALPR